MADDDELNAKDITTRTYTSFWNLERKLYSFQDIQLPVPIPVKALGLFVVAAAPWGLLCWLIGLPLSNSWGFILWFGPPFAFAYFGNKPSSIFNGKKLTEFLISILHYSFEGKHYKGLNKDLNDYSHVQKIKLPVVIRKTADWSSPDFRSKHINDPLRERPYFIDSRR